MIRVLHNILVSTLTNNDLPKWLSVKEPDCQCRRLGFDPWEGKIPWRRKWQPPPVFLPGESHVQRSLVGYSPQGRKESDTTKHVCMLTNNCHVLFQVWSSFYIPGVGGKWSSLPSFNHPIFKVSANILKEYWKSKRRVIPFSPPFWPTFQARGKDDRKQWFIRKLWCPSHSKGNFVNFYKLITCIKRVRDSRE